MDKFLTKRPAEPSTDESNKRVARVDESVSGLMAALKDESWRDALQREFSKDYMKRLADKVAAARQKGQVYPAEKDVFAAFNLTPFQQVRVVILGQDPYHGTGQAHGLSFSVQRGVAVPPSLKNIYKELNNDVPGFETPAHGNLESWARQGVLCLNATLTVQAHNANSHADYGWQTFTDGVIRALNERTKGLVFILWGGFAQKKGKIISRDRHCVLEAAHPSPLSVTKFLGCRVFSKTNAYLEKQGSPIIDWQLPS